MFESLRLHGTSGSVVWGYQTAATIKRWSIKHHIPDAKHDDRWTLHAQLDRVLDKFQLQRRPLLFTAPRDKGPPWCWPMDTASIQVSDTHLTATLGPPEQ